MKLELKIPDGFLEETRTEFIVASKTKELWAVQLDLLAKIDSICRKYGIRYSIDSGTLIGAMRHGGFIPWDDDIDVIMPRLDYDRFSKIVSGEIGGDYFFQNWKNSPGYYRAFGRLLNIRTSAIAKGDLVRGRSMWKYPQGVFVDILIVDNIPDDDSLREEHFRKLHHLYIKYWVARSYVAYFNNFTRLKITLGGLHKFVLGAVLRLLGLLGFNLIDWWFAAFNSELERYNDQSTECGAPYTNRPYEILKLCEFDNLVDVKFEFLKVKAFGNYDSILKQQYGDWRRHVIGARAPIIYDIKEVL